MRACLILCFTLTIQSVLCEDTGLFKYKDVKFKSYKDLIHPKVAIWSSKWQSKKGLYPKKASSNLYAKRPNTDARFRDYTAFAPYDENNRFIDVPDSPYFPIDHHFQQRTRIKKVLPENYPLLSRVRRAAPKQAAKPVAKNLPPLKVVKQGKLPAKAPGKTGNTQVKKAARTLAKGSAKLPRPANKVRQASNAARNLNKRQKPKRQVLRKAKNNKKNQSGQRRNRNRRAQGQINNNQRNNKQPNNQKNQDQAGRRNVKPSQAKPGAKQAAKPAAKKQKDASARRLISAKDADIEEFPYVVSIQKDSEHWCAGALLNQRMVVTTANCVWKSSSLSRMRVRVGSRHLDHGGQKVGIQEVMKHPHWSIRRNPDNDVALLLLDREVKFSDSVHAADLPNKVMMPPFDDAWVTSWGTERRDGVYKHQEKTLQMYHARLMDQSKCNNITRRYGVLVTDNFICLAQDGHRAPCTRDTGAPAVSDGILWGLASWSIRKLCGTEKFPAVFSYLGSISNQEFIMNATHYLMADERYNPFPDHLPRDVGRNLMG